MHLLEQKIQPICPFFVLSAERRGFIYLFIYYENRTQSTDKNKNKKGKKN